MTYSLEDISVSSRWILLNFCWVSTFFDILFLNILWTVAQTSIKHIIFWKSMKKWSHYFFLFTFWALTVCDIHFWIWKLSKFTFMGSRFWSILVCKIPEFWRWKLWDQNFVPFVSGNIHIKETKKTGFTFAIQLIT